MELTQAHFDWSQCLAEMDRAELKAQVQIIQDAACELGIWQRGGYVPLQPFVVEKRASDRLNRLGAQLRDLLIRHALETSGNDMGTLADIAELAPEDRWFLGAKRPLPEALGCRRFDVFVSNGKPYFLELNFGTCLNGGTSTPVLSAALLGSAVGVEMRRRHDITTDSFFAARTQWVRQQLPTTSPAVALVGFSGDGDEGSLKEFEAETAYFSAHGIPCDFVPAEEADISDGTLVWRGKRYGTAIRYFMVTQKVRRDHLEFVVALEHAAHTRLLGAYISQLFTSKALLADLYHEPSLTAEQRRILDHVPWTARLREGFARRGEERVNPVTWAAENRERAVLKPYNLFGSRGVLIGHRTTESDWHSALEDRVKNGGYIVQELVQPDSWNAAYWHTAQEALVQIESPVLVGPFDIDGRSGGCFTKQPITGASEDLLDRTSDISFGCVVSAS